MRNFILIILKFLMLQSLFWNYDSLHVEAAERLYTDDDLVIVIDPGHGGENLGTTENGFQEKDMTLVTAQAMYRELLKYDNVTVYLTREDDRELSLKERAQFAENVDADFLFSIHYNASLEHKVYGAEVWIPAHAPYHAYAYQFAYTELAELRDIGLFSRGIKTRVEGDVEYYGIIRESLKLSIPALIIEHCHVDNRTDSIFCDTEEEQVAFGVADATAVAKFLGLKSSVLGIDYGDYDSFPELGEDSIVDMTLNKGTPPDVCRIEAGNIDEETGVIEIRLTASDQDSVIVYYEYSIDGGTSYYPLTVWPDTDVFEGGNDEEITVPVQIPAGIKAKIKFRVYNLFDQTKESNIIALSSAFYYETKTSEEQTSVVEVDADEVIGGDFTEKGEKFSFHFEKLTELWEQNKEKLMSNIEIVLVLALLIMSLILSILFVRYIGRQRRKRRRRRR